MGKMSIRLRQYHDQVWSDHIQTRARRGAVSGRSPRPAPRWNAGQGGGLEEAGGGRIGRGRGSSTHRPAGDHARRRAGLPAWEPPRAGYFSRASSIPPKRTQQWASNFGGLLLCDGRAVRRARIDLDAGQPDAVDRSLMLAACLMDVRARAAIAPPRLLMRLPSVSRGEVRWPRTSTTERRDFLVHACVNRRY